MPQNPEIADAMLKYYRPMEARSHLPIEGYENINWFSKAELERCDRLDAIPRYSAIEEMTHRSSVGDHVVRVTTLTVFGTDMLLNLGYELDQPRAVLYADHHDDTEIPDMKDIPSPVKRKVKGKKKKELEERERKAVEEVEHLVAKPTWIESYKQLYEDYKRQDTIEARVVNYMDKWDGLYEAVHEVICGNNKDDFKRVIEEYRPTFEELNEINKSWHKVAGLVLAADLFEFPEPDKLIPKKPEDLDWSSAQNLMKSVVRGNPNSYMFWLMASQHTYKFLFLSRVFPGWMEHVPGEVWEDIDRVERGDKYKITESGLLIPATEIDPENPTFGESLTFEALKMIIDGRGEKIRQQRGLRRARGKYYNVQQYLDEE